jgi:8-oxo-dGTP pyrophosphatase MutT (NUDIX family)
MILHTAGLLHLQNRKLLLAYSKNKNCFYLPGGKVNAGESAKEALCREVAEELNVVLQPDELRYHTHITAPAFGEMAGTIMEQDCFLLLKAIAPNAAAEIGELKYFSLNDYLAETTQAPGAVLVLQQLKEEGLID